MRRVLLGLAVALGAAATAQADTLEITVDGSVKGTIEIELLPDVAPKHVAQIEALAKSGAYDGVVFHRVIDGFMAQTGDVQFGRKGSPDIARAGMGGSDLPDIKAEFSDLPFVRGTVGMARSQDPDSANSQFFIMFAPSPSLDGNYTVVGKVISGQDVVDQIARGDGANGEVSDPDWMAKVTVKAD